MTISTFLHLQVRSLELASYQVYTATSGDEALKKARNLHPSVITLDIMMPSMDGWDILKQLKTDPELKDTPVIICSIIDEKQQGPDLGTNNYLTKSIQRATLQTAVNHACCKTPISSKFSKYDRSSDLQIVITTRKNSKLHDFSLAEKIFPAILNPYNLLIENSCVGDSLCRRDPRGGS